MNVKELMAIFIGAKVKGNPILNEYEMYGFIEAIQDGENEQHFYVPNEMPFDTDWNWLMEVVKCIKEKAIEINYFDIVGLSQRLNAFDYDIKSIYKGCVEFIKWYNSQKV